MDVPHVIELRRHDPTSAALLVELSRESNNTAGKLERSIADVLPVFKRRRPFKLVNVTMEEAHAWRAPTWDRLDCLRIRWLLAQRWKFRRPDARRGLKFCRTEFLIPNS